MMRCPDPGCAAELKAETWVVEDVTQNPGVVRVAEELGADPVAQWYWSTICPSCQRHVGCTMLDNDTIPCTPADLWCCPLCGHDATVVHRHRGPLDISLRCEDGCGAKTTIARKGI